MLHTDSKTQKSHKSINSTKKNIWVCGEGSTAVLGLPAGSGLRDLSGDWVTDGVLEIN